MSIQLFYQSHPIWSRLWPFDNPSCLPLSKKFNPVKINLTDGHAGGLYQTELDVEMSVSFILIKPILRSHRPTVNLKGLAQPCSLFIKPRSILKNRGQCERNQF